MKRVTVFGATGSIGQNTLDLIARAPQEYQVVALTGGRNIAQLAADARRLGAELAVTAHDDLLGDLRAALAGSGVQAAAGQAALIEAAARPADWIMSAIVGAAGLAPGFQALRHGTTLALANKESLVTAGPLLLQEAARHGATNLGQGGANDLAIVRLGPARAIGSGIAAGRQCKAGQQHCRGEAPAQLMKSAALSSISS